MSVYMDKAGHIVADTLDELHAFVARLGHKRAWFQDHKLHPHYDVKAAYRRTLARRYGAIMVSTNKVVQIAHKLAQERDHG